MVEHESPKLGVVGSIPTTGIYAMGLRGVSEAPFVCGLTIELVGLVV